MFFGCLYNCNGVCPDPVKVVAIADMPAPTLSRRHRDSWEWPHTWATLYLDFLTFSHLYRNLPRKMLHLPGMIHSSVSLITSSLQSLVPQHYATLIPVNPLFLYKLMCHKKDLVLLSSKMMRQLHIQAMHLLPQNADTQTLGESC